MTDKQMIEELEAEESMFVQTAHGMTSDGTNLTLTDVTPSTLYFSDRPKRIVGHMATSDFVELWAEGDNSFEEDPPNAVLSFLQAGDEVPEDAVVVIQHPRLRMAGSPTRSRHSKGPFRRRLVPSRCSSTHSDGRSRPYRCAEFDGVSGVVIVGGSSARTLLRSESGTATSAAVPGSGSISKGPRMTCAELQTADRW